MTDPAALAAASLASPILGQSLFDTFTTSPSIGGWTFDSPGEFIDDFGSPITRYLRAPNVTAVFPQARSSGLSAFTGNWREREISALGFEGRVFAATVPQSREPTLILSNGSCTVARPLIDLLPQPGRGWRTFEFPIDFASPTIPPMWQATSGCGSANDAWNQVITNVTEVRISFGNPTSIAVSATWDLGLENVYLREGVGQLVCSGSFRNSTGERGELALRGSSVFADNNLSATMFRLPQDSFGFLIGSSTLGTVPSTGQPPGLLCVRGNIGRFVDQIASSGGGGEITTLIDLTAIPTSTGFVSAQAGETWGFQGWHRDVDAFQQSTSYFTAAQAVTLR